MALLTGRKKTQLIASVDTSIDTWLREQAQLESRPLSYYVNVALHDYQRSHTPETTTIEGTLNE
jgi:hypothetical protein